MKKMKKEYIEPEMRLAELRHQHHILQGSKNIYDLSHKPFGKFDDEKDVIGDDDEDDII